MTPCSAKTSITKNKLKGWNWRFRRFLYNLEVIKDRDNIEHYRNDLTDEEIEILIQEYKEEHPKPEND